MGVKKILKRYKPKLARKKILEENDVIIYNFLMGLLTNLFKNYKNTKILFKNLLIFENNIKIKVWIYDLNNT